MLLCLRLIYNFNLTATTLHIEYESSKEIHNSSLASVMLHLEHESSNLTHIYNLTLLRQSGKCFYHLCQLLLR